MFHGNVSFFIFYNNFGPEVLAQKQIREFTYFYKVSTDFYLNFLKIEAINFLGQSSQTHISIGIRLTEMYRIWFVTYVCMDGLLGQYSMCG